MLSDTHSQAWPLELEEAWRKADGVVHAGDFCRWTDVEKCSREKKIFYGVRGNMDEPDAVRRLPEMAFFSCEGLRFGVIHGQGAPEAVFGFVQRALADKNCDVVIFGHSHRPMIETKGRTIYINPGSPTDLIFAPYRSFVWLIVERGNARPRLVRIRSSR